MTRIAITGAAGTVGTVALDAFPDVEITAIDLDSVGSDHEHVDEVTADITDADAIESALSDHEIVLHLAANPSPEATWAEVLRTNIEGTFNVFEAAVANGVDRLVFASSVHYHHMYNMAQADRPETIAENPRPVYPDEPPRPTSYYGVSKVTAEALATYHADRYGIEVVCLRFGWVLSRDELLELQGKEETVAHFARVLWLSHEDCKHGLRRAVTAPLAENPLRLPLTSSNDERYFSLTKTMRSLDYRPSDNSAAVASDR